MSDGLFVYDRDQRRRTPPPFGSPPGIVWALALDRGGWFWLGAAGLWIVKDGQLRPMSAIPGVSLRPITWLEVDDVAPHGITAESWPSTIARVIVHSY